MPLRLPILVVSLSTSHHLTLSQYLCWLCFCAVINEVCGTVPLKWPTVSRHKRQQSYSMFHTCSLACPARQAKDFGLKKSKNKHFSSVHPSSDDEFIHFYKRSSGQFDWLIACWVLQHYSTVVDSSNWIFETSHLTYLRVWPLLSAVLLSWVHDSEHRHMTGKS